MSDHDPTANRRHVSKPQLHLLLNIFVLVFAAACVWVSAVSTSPLSETTRDLAIALGPVGILGVLYQAFLFDEIRAGARAAVGDDVQEAVAAPVKSLKAAAEGLVEQTRVLKRLEEVGIVDAYLSRKDALGLIRQWIMDEPREIAIAGTSLRGLFWEELVGGTALGEALGQRLQDTCRPCNFRFILTHPACAYLREQLEHMQRPEDFQIAQEVYDSVMGLRALGARPPNIQFVKGTPTCFAIQTSEHLLVNPYLYRGQALSSVCMVFSKTHHYGRTVYESFHADHFGVWDTKMAAKFIANDWTAAESELRQIFRQDLASDQVGLRPQAPTIDFHG